MSVEVLNGTVDLGDEIAYPTRTGSALDMITAFVIEIRENVTEHWDGSFTSKLVVQPLLESDWKGAYDIGDAKPRVISELYRVVKLG